jgi:hypothetical protein
MKMHQFLKCIVSSNIHQRKVGPRVTLINLRKGIKIWNVLRFSSIRQTIVVDKNNNTEEKKTNKSLRVNRYTYTLKV